VSNILVDRCRQRHSGQLIRMDNVYRLIVKSNNLYSKYKTMDVKLTFISCSQKRIRFMTLYAVVSVSN
jgi:hypothetical protein